MEESHVDLAQRAAATPAHVAGIVDAGNSEVAEEHEEVEDEEQFHEAPVKESPVPSSASPTKSSAPSSASPTKSSAPASIPSPKKATPAPIEDDEDDVLDLDADDGNNVEVVGHCTRFFGLDGQFLTFCFSYFDMLLRSFSRTFVFVFLPLVRRMTRMWTTCLRTIDRDGPSCCGLLILVVIHVGSRDCMRIHAYMRVLSFL